MAVKIVKLIYCDSERAGTGESEDSPIRCLQQLFTLDGRLICQYDPHCHESSIPKDRWNGGTIFTLEPSVATVDVEI